MDQGLLRRLPRVDELLEKAVPVVGEDVKRTLLTESIREILEDVRREICRGEREELPNDQALIRRIAERYRKKTQRHLRPVVNATGITLHTNLGRSLLSDAAVKAVAETASSYSNLEYRLEQGKRGSRYEHIEDLLIRLCGCESAIVVNNNAAAVLLVLSTIGKGKEVIVSRGELVEIGGSFRIPEIMEMSGAVLREVGATNKTRRQDYSDAIGEETAALLKVHTSNFRMLGFTQQATVEELAELGQEMHLPVLYDMGSGFLLRTERFAHVNEPNVRDALKAGADLVTFSGDKLLGGPQAGIIAGKKALVDEIKRNPLIRALRVDKMTLAALEVTLRQYVEEDPWKVLPTLQMLDAKEEELEANYASLRACLSGLEGVQIEKVLDTTEAGGGSLPGILFPTVCMSVHVPGFSETELEAGLRRAKDPVIARIHQGQLLLDLRTIRRGDGERIRNALQEVMGQRRGPGDEKNE